ncbi:MAG: transporter associated domain-containing protein [Brevinematales bacterium]|jgi:magnesium and cobalt transporter
MDHSTLKERAIKKHVILDELSKITASDIMIPRGNVVLINSSSSFQEITEIVITDGHSRFPVYSSRIDNIIGILYVKDMLQFFKITEVDFDIIKILRKPLFVSENKKASELLSLFREERVHLAIVVDEYGTMVGIISLEDILEEIVGDISDEYDKEKKQNYRIIGASEYIIYPQMSLAEFNELFKTRINSKIYETIGGFILERFGYVPKSGESIIFGGYNFEIQKAEGSRIKEILLKKR